MGALTITNNLAIELPGSAMLLTNTAWNVTTGSIIASGAQAQRREMP